MTVWTEVTNSNEKMHSNCTSRGGERVGAANSVGIADSVGVADSGRTVDGDVGGGFGRVDDRGNALVQRKFTFLILATSI